MNTYKCSYKEYNDNRTSYWCVVRYIVAESFDEAFKKIRAKKPNVDIIDLTTDRQSLMM